jgi:hypothetical protein
MRILLTITLSCLLAGGAMAQRGGGGARGGGGFHGGGGFGGGFHGGGGYGGGFVGNRGGFGGGFVGNRGGFGFGYRGYGYRGYGGWGWGGWGLGVGWWPGYDYGYYDPYYGYPAYDSYSPYYSSPNVTVVYPSQAQPTYNAVYAQPARPVSHEYDEYGQEIRPSAQAMGGGASSSGSPIYLIAMKDGIIRAAASYSVSGSTLHYVTLDHAEKQVALADVDRTLSAQLNRERRVQFSLPQPATH